MSDTVSPALDLDRAVRLLNRVAFLIDRVGFDLDIAEMVGTEPGETNPREDINQIDAEQDRQAEELCQLAALLPALVERQRDTERLDWLTVVGNSVRGFQLDGQWLFVARDASVQSQMYRTPREAIDEMISRAARSAVVGVEGGQDG